jgi:hypothetical protein
MFGIAATLLPSNISGAACANTGPVATGSVGTEADRSGNGSGLPAPRSGPRWCVNTNRGPETQEVIAPMPCPNPTGGGHAIALEIPAGNLPFLRRVITAARGGLRDDLEGFADQLRQPRSALLLEDAAYATLLTALDRRWIVPDDELRAALARLAGSVDHDNEYGRVAFEHDALYGLLAQLDGPVA